MGKGYSAPSFLLSSTTLEIVRRRILQKCTAARKCITSKATQLHTGAFTATLWSLFLKGNEMSISTGASSRLSWWRVSMYRLGVLLLDSCIPREPQPRDFMPVGSCACAVTEPAVSTAQGWAGFAALCTDTAVLGQLNSLQYLCSTLVCVLYPPQCLNQGSGIC